MSPRRALPVAAATALLLCPVPALAQANGYLDHADLTEALSELVDASEHASMTSIATSPGDLEVWMLEIADPDGIPLDERPAVLVVGNLNGSHLVGSQLALEAARHLVSGGDAIGPLLAEHVFYVAPRLNPDGAEALFEDVLTGRALNARPVDDDNDGRLDEDPPEDLNGDGLITVMRVPDSLGRFLPDPAQPRLMTAADPGQSRGGGYTLYWEGLDSDGDGFYNEDGPGGVDLDRNFQHAYPYYTRDAGPHMVSEPETRGLMDFVLAHDNLAAILTFGPSDNLVTPPDASGELAPGRTLALNAYADESNAGVFDVGVYSSFSPTGALDLRGAQPGSDNDPDSGRRPAVTVNEADLEYFEAVSELYRDITGIERVGLNRPAEGAFFQFGYFQFGVPSFSTQGWAVPDPEPVEEAGDEPAEPEASDSPDAELLGALEALGMEVFSDWSSFDHPELGEVEIGGFQPYAAMNPPRDTLGESGRMHGEFVVELARMLPRVRIASTEVESHGGGLFTVTVEVENSGYLPTALQHGVVSGSVDPVTVRIGVPPEDLLTGHALTSRIERLEGSGSREEFQWLIRGEEGEEIEIRARSQKSGTDVVAVTLGGE